MSFTKARTRSAEESTTEKDPTKCAAYGCKCRATVLTSGKDWACFAHAFAEMDDWQEITKRLHQHDWLLGLLNDLRKMDRAHQDWRSYAMQFWLTEDKFCRPEPYENALPYQNRMLLEILYRIGQSPKRPQPRNPATPTAAGYFNRRKAIACAQ